MALLWFLKLALKFLHHFAWPLLALVYPLCASVQAIETDSNKETRDLISYWILLSLIYLFEYAFSRLLHWFQFWPYFKLMIIFWLIMPDFRRASYAYNNVIRTCISLNPQAVMCRLLNNWRKLFVKNDDFLLHVERYVNENGTEALDKLIASKNTTYKPDAEGTNAIRGIDNKETQQTNEKKPQTEHKAIEDLEVIEKKEIPAGKQDIPVVPNLVPNQNASPAMVETKGLVEKVKDKARILELPQSSTHKEVQKEWTCALCHVTTSSEKTLIDHIHGRKHKATFEALKAQQNQPAPQKVIKSDQAKEELKQKNIRKHKATCEALKAQQNQPAPQKVNSKTKNGESAIVNRGGLKGGTEVMDHNKVQKLQKKPDVSHSKFRCEVCNVNCPCQIALTSHNNGKKHLAKIKTLI